jgi:6-phosphogluconolactonase
MKLNIYPDDSWALQSSKIIFNKIYALSIKKNKISIILTGGRSAKKIYNFLKNDLKILNTQIDFYISDERHVPITHDDSNYKLIFENLFNKKINNKFSLYNIYDPNIEIAKINYLNKLPKIIDILILGLGDDGHIASIFPNTKKVNFDEKIMITKSKHFKHTRITITENVIRKANNVFILASGLSKQNIVNKILNGKYMNLPANLVINRTWLIDKTAFNLKK